MNIFAKFPRTFWVANSIELFERWAWYGFFMLFANYLTGSSDQGGLEFTQSEKGIIMGVGTGILYFLPVITGAIADRYGYKRMLAVAFIIYASAFILLPMFDTFIGVLLMYIYLAVGAALFKPIIAATISKTTTSKTSSIGFGIYYMMVNIGAFFGPMVTLIYKNESRWVFYISAGFILLNFILLLFYREPQQADTGKQAVQSLNQTLEQLFINIITAFRDVRFVLFLLIIAGFWIMYNQLFFTLPVFVAQWVDTSVLYDFFHSHIPFVTANYSPEPGVLDAEFITNTDALFIILLQIVVSSIVMRMKPLSSMISGFIVCTIGMALTVSTQNVLFVIAAILIFSIGEMAGSPKITEYIGSIAPADKKALYMGYSFIPVCLGNIGAGYISGAVYQRMSDKVSLVRQYVAEQGFQISETSSNNAYFAEVARQAGLSDQQLTQVLWDTYHPAQLAWVLLAIGIASALLLWIYNYWTGKRDAYRS